MRGERSGRHRMVAVAGVAAAVGVLVSSRSALADCMPAPPFSGATVVCSGAVNAPFTASGLGSLTVDIQPGTSFNAIFANASYQAGLEGESEAWDGKLGLRVNW